jgi:hypothetical protein
MDGKTVIPQRAERFGEAVGRGQGTTIAFLTKGNDIYFLAETPRTFKLDEPSLFSAR